MKRISLDDLGAMIENGQLQCPVEYCEYCRKIGYPTEKDAKDGARDMAREGKGHSWAYECHKGKGWHLTSHRPRGSRPRARRSSPSRRRREGRLH